jgi:glycosyltransferase involved in cell wall biosynthesis
MSRASSVTVAFLTSARAWRGSGVSLANIAHGLRERGHRPHLLAGEHAVVEGFAHRGLPAQRVPTADTTLPAVLALARALRTLRADCLIVDRPRDLRLGALASVLYPVRLINRYNLSRTRPPRDFVSRLAYHQVSLTIFVSHTNARQALGAGRYLSRRPYRVIHEGVGPEFHPDTAAAAAFKAQLELSGRDFVLAVGSLTADKRYSFLLHAFNHLGKSAPVLVVCGDGPLRDQLQSEARDLAVDARFLGLVDAEALRGAYSSALCFVHACGIETFGLSVLEAMACACPVVAVNQGAVPEVLGDTGILSSDQPADFAGQLRDLMDSPERQRALGSAGRQRATSLFSLARMQREHSEAVKSVCSIAPQGIEIRHAGSAPPGV